MRILHIVPLVSDDSAFGGPVRGTARQCHSLEKLGHNCYILGLWRGEGTAPGDVLGVPATLYKFRKLPGHRFATAISFGALSWIARHRRDYDCVHVHAGRDLWILLAMILMRILGIPYVWQTHGMLAPRDGIVYKVYDATLTLPALKGAESVLYLTEYERRDLASVGRTSRVDHVVNGVDNISSDGEIPALRGDTSTRAVFISRIHPRKRLIDLVEAIMLVRDSGMDARLDIYGPDEGALSAVLSAIKKVNLEEAISYRGPLPYDQVRPTLRDYDVMVLPSVNEPFPNIVLESLASGVPVVLTNSCGLAPYVNDYEAGLVVTPGAESLAEGIAAIAQNPELARKSQANGLRLANEKFTMSGVAGLLSDVYRGGSAK